MRVQRLDPGDQAAIGDCFGILRAADAIDDPHGPPWSSPRRLRGWIEYPMEPEEIWTGIDEATGTTVGWYYLMLPARENRDRAYLHRLIVAPPARRRGIGTALLAHAAGRAAANGRPVLAGEALEDSAGVAFATRAGAAAGLTEARRVLDLAAIPAGRIAALHAEAATATDGYSLLRWDGRIPAEYQDRYAAAENAMADAPHDAGEEPWAWTADRVREQDDRRERRGQGAYTLAVRHDASGELAALTVVETSADDPAWAFQLTTVVTRPHRGHRLGLLAKTAMLEWLAVAEPRLERIATGNADSNRHMIAINETLGYRLLPPAARGFELAVADVIAAGPGPGPGTGVGGGGEGAA